jgi:hypothetical protein
LAGSKFRAATLDTISDVCDFVQAKITNDDNHVQRRRRNRQTKSDIHLSSNFGQEIRNGLQINPNKQRLNSLAQVNIYPLNNTSKRPSNETLLSSQLNSRRQSKVAMNVDEV